MRMVCSVPGAAAVFSASDGAWEKILVSEREEGLLFARLFAEILKDLAQLLVKSLTVPGLRGNPGGRLPEGHPQGRYEIRSEWRPGQNPGARPFLPGRVFSSLSIGSSKWVIRGADARPHIIEWKRRRRRSES